MLEHDTTQAAIHTSLYFIFSYIYMKLVNMRTRPQSSQSETRRPQKRPIGDIGRGVNALSLPLPLLHVLLLLLLPLLLLVLLLLPLLTTTTAATATATATT